jgi:hypothetical protein
MTHGNSSPRLGVPRSRPLDPTIAMVSSGILGSNLTSAALGMLSALFAYLGSARPMRGQFACSNSTREWNCFNVSTDNSIAAVSPLMNRHVHLIKHMAEGFHAVRQLQPLSGPHATGCKSRNTPALNAQRRSSASSYQASVFGDMPQNQ